MIWQPEFVFANIQAQLTCGSGWEGIFIQLNENPLFTIVIQLNENPLFTMFILPAHFGPRFDKTPLGGETLPLAYSTPR